MYESTRTKEIEVCPLGQQAVPANNANNASNEGAQKKHMSKAAVAIIAVVVVAIIVVAGVFGFRAYSDAQYNNAVAACAAASEKCAQRH